MRFPIVRWKQIYWFIMLPVFFSVPIYQAVATTISNTASFAGDNINSRNTNSAIFTAQTPTLQITKTADKITVKPGDTVLYRIAIRNTGTVNANNLVLTDTLPRGLVLETRSVQASLISSNSNNSSRVGSAIAIPVTSSRVDDRNININFAGSLPPSGIINLVYAATVTPDALRGNGRNLAIANVGSIRSNTASHQLRLRPGIFSDCGTLIGRVFVDKNFDGEQQNGEPGIPNAVIFLDDGNRILTDSNGMFSVANVIAGNRTGTLDLTSLPGYILAPNQRKIERNGQSRLVKLAPSGMARMNFAVTPAFREGK